MSKSKPPKEDDKPPVLNSWKSFYVLVLGVLVGLIIIFYLITNQYS